MARQQQDILDRLCNCFSLRGFLLHQATLVILATGCLIGVAIFLWDSNRETITQLPEYQLNREKITLSPTPRWADQDLKQLVLDTPNPSDNSILDTHLVSRTAHLMQSVGFVESVRSVEKSKNRLDIDLVYRQPVAFVEISKTTIPRSANSTSTPLKSVLVPVDREGVLMPEEIADQAWLPKILIPFPAQHDNRTTWSQWPDQRIHDAASICFLFGKTAEAIDITTIVSWRHPNIAAKTNAPYELWTNHGDGTIVVWGNAPGSEVKGEASADEKIEALKEFIAVYGPLKNRAHKKIDIRTGTALPVTQSQTAQNTQDIFSERK